jgi:hypothetical protein
MFRVVLQEVIGVWYSLWTHVRVDAAIRALKTDLLVIFEQEPLIPVQYYRHLVAIFARYYLILNLLVKSTS